MQTKKCPECLAEIPEKAKKCKHCGTKQPVPMLKRPVFYLILLMFLPTFIMGLISGYKGDSQSVSSVSVSQEKESISSEQIQKNKELFNSLKEIGTIKKVDSSFNEIYVDLEVWETLPIDVKKSVASVSFIYCTTECQFENFVKIKDYLSGKDLAKYSTLGFKIY